MAETVGKLKWDQLINRKYETGVDHGVLYPQENGTYPKGFAWDGLTSVAENPSGGEDSPYYADNIKYFNLKSNEEFGLTIGCYYYPEEFKACNGETEVAEGVTLGQQRRNTFGFTYRTKLGNAADGQDYGFKLHMVYGCSASPSSKTYSSVNESPEPGELSYEVTTTPLDVPGKDATGKPYKPVSVITIDSTRVNPEKLAMLEKILYGSDEIPADPEDAGSTATPATQARLPLPEEIMALFAEG